MVKVFDFTGISGLTYEDRHKNVLYKTKDFKIRVIDLPGNGSIPECNMESYVVFVVMKGQVDVTVNGKIHSLNEKQSLASEPATFSMKTSNGVKLMGIQIQKHKK